LSKNLLTPLYWLLALAFPLCLAQCRPHASPEILGRLDSLLREKDFFRLEALFASEGDQLDRAHRLFIRAHLDNAFNRNLAAAKEVDTLLSEFKSAFPDSTRAALLLLREDCHFKLFQYAAAAADDSSIIHGYAHAIGAGALADVRNNFLLRNGLRFTPRQMVDIPGAAEIPWQRDVLGLMDVPVRHDNVQCSGIFDSRANISSITETYARKLGLRLLPVHYTESSGITGIEFTTGLGVADSIYIGDLLVRNVVFQVMPDSILYIAPANVTLNVIIGFPVIAAMGEIHIFRNGRIVVPAAETPETFHNLALDRLDPVVAVAIWKDTLAFDLDLGADDTNLYYEFYGRYRERIHRQAIEKDVHYGGAGGIKERKVYVLPALPVTLAGKRVVLDSVNVITEPIYPGQRLYGNLGIDFAQQFNEFVLNFDSMYVKGN